MPFRSRRQQRWAFSTGQPFAKRWAKETPSFAALPERKDAGADAGASLHGPGGLLGVPGVGGRPRKWGNRSKNKACTCGVNIATKEQIAPGITRIRGNLCNVHGRYGPCDPSKPTKAKPRKGRKPAKPKKPVLTPEQRQAAHAQQQADNRTQVLSQMGIAPDGQAALERLRAGQQADPGALARGGFEKAGLVEQAADGSYRLTASGRAMLSAANSGDAGRAGDTISSARDRTSARTQRQADAAKRKQDAAARRAAAAAKKPKAGGGRGGSRATPSSASSSAATHEAERQAQRAQRQTEHQQDRAARQAEHAADRARAQQEHEQDRAARQRPQTTRVAQARPVARSSGAPLDYGIRRTHRRVKAFLVYKSANGAYRWIARTTTAYRDRDGEIITTKALEADAARMTATGVYGPLRYWHIGEPDPFDVAAPWGPGLDIGTCDYSTVIGRTSIESGTFKDAAIGKAFAESADDYELSPGFFHPPNQPNAAGEYADIRRFERSPVPIQFGRASNLFTGLTVKGAHMDQATYDARVKAFTQDMNAKGVPPEVAAQALAGMQQADKSAAAQGIAFKSEDTQPADPWQAVVAALKAALVPAEKAPPPMDQGAPMDAAPPDELDDGTDGEGAEEGSYIGDMSIADFEQLLMQTFQQAIQQFGSAITTHMGALDEAVKGMGYARTKAESAATAEIATLKTRLAELEGSKPAVTLPAEIEAALKSDGPQAPPDGNAMPTPENPLQAAAMATFPTLYRPNADGTWAGWQPLPPLNS
jgi:hypothetical protein